MSTTSEKERSEFSLVGLLHKLCLAAEKVGWTKAHFNLLAESSELLEKFLLVLNCRAEVILRSFLNIVRVVRIGAQPAVFTSREYFERMGVSKTDERFDAQFLGLEVPETEEIELFVYQPDGEFHGDLMLAKLGDKTESISTLCAFLSVNRGRSERFLFFLRGKDGKPEVVVVIPNKNGGYMTRAVGRGRFWWTPFTMVVSSLRPRL